MTVNFRLDGTTFWAGSRAVVLRPEDIEVDDIEIGAHPYLNRRIRVRLENGWVLSTIWGSLTYSSNHNHPFGVDYTTVTKVEPEFIERPTTVEVAAWPTRSGRSIGPYYQWRDGDTVLPYVTVPMWWGALRQVSHFPTTKTLFRR